MCECVGVGSGPLSLRERAGVREADAVSGIAWSLMRLHPENPLGSSVLMPSYSWAPLTHSPPPHHPRARRDAPQKTPMAATAKAALAADNGSGTVDVTNVSALPSPPLLKLLAKEPVNAAL